MATGCLSSRNTPDFPGLERYGGQSFHTGDWPEEGVDLSSKRVGIIGTGSTAIQAIPILAAQSGQLFVFQRPPPTSRCRLETPRWIRSFRRGSRQTIRVLVCDLLGSPEVLIHNAVGGAMGDFMSIDPQRLNQNFQVNTMALLHLARMAAPKRIEAGRGAILCTGNTSTYRGKALFAGFAPTKAAQRILAESMARTLGPQGIYVS